MAERPISQLGAMSVRETVLVLFDHGERLYKLSQGDRAGASDELGVDVIVHVDSAQTSCAGFAISLRNGKLADPRGAIDVLQKIAVVENPQVKAWLTKHAGTHPMMAAWICAVELLRLKLIEYSGLELSSASFSQSAH
jgi:hypothetical protein